MRISLSIFIIFYLITGCVGTDFVEDRVNSLTISVEGTSLVNNAIAALPDDTFMFKATARNDRGSVFEPSVEWHSSDSNVASIDENGNLIALSVGTATITATAFDSTSNDIKVHVVDSINDVALIEISGERNNIAVGENLTLSAQALNVLGETIENVVISWSSPNESIASVSDQGVVTGIAQGSVNIIASAEGISSAFTVNVGQASNRTGKFESLNGYDTEGTVILETDGRGGITLNLQDDFKASSGPGLYIYLSNNRSNITGGVEIAALRSTSGADSYNVPSGVDLFDYDYVLIYCKPFGVGFGTAKLE